MFDILVRSKIFKLQSYNSKYRREMNGIKQRFSVFLVINRVKPEILFPLNDNFIKT